MFGEPTKLILDDSGLFHHCSQYGVTLIIPEGAVQQSASVWFAVCLLSDKFNFGDYVPVTPIVWVYVDQKLLKPAELYLPHHLDIGKVTNELVRLTATDDSKFQFQKCEMYQFDIEGTVFKLFSPHFCSNCIAVDADKYRKIPKRYLIGKSFKEETDRDYIQFVYEFSFLYCQQKCIEVSQFVIINHFFFRH